MDTGGAQVQGLRSKERPPHGLRIIPLNTSEGVHSSIVSSNQPDDSRPNPSLNWPAGRGNTGKKVPLPPLWTWSQGPSNVHVPHTGSKVPSEEGSGGDRGSEDRGGGQWHNVEGKGSSTGSLSTSNSMSADDIFQPSSSSSPPVSSHTLGGTQGSSSSLAGASGPLNRIHGLASTAKSSSADASFSSSAVHPHSSSLNERQSSREDDESEGDDCDSCLYSVSTTDQKLDPDPDPSLSTASVPLPIPIPIIALHTASHSSLSEGDLSETLALGRKSPRSLEGVGVGSHADPGPDLGSAGIPLGEQQDKLLSEERDGVMALTPHSPLMNSDRAAIVSASAPLEGEAPTGVAGRESVSPGGEGSRRAVSAMMGVITPRTGLSDRSSCEGFSVHTGGTESGTRTKSESNSKDESSHESNDEGKGDSVSTALAAAGRHLREAQMRAQVEADKHTEKDTDKHTEKDTDKHTDKDTEKDEEYDLLLSLHESLAVSAPDLTSTHTGRVTDIEGDGTPPSLLGVEMLEEESV